MRHQGYISSNEHDLWLSLEVTLGNNTTLIEAEEAKFNSFLKGFDNLQLREIEEITGLSIDDSYRFTVTNKNTLRMLMLKQFMNGTGIEIIKEARPGIGSVEEDIYLNLLDSLIKEDQLPHDIYAYSVYRKRGTPVSWMNLSSSISSEEVKHHLDGQTKTIINSLNWHMKTHRKLVLNSDVAGMKIILLSKPTGAKVVKAEKKNVEVSSASYTIIVYDETEHRIGVVSGVKKEISAIYSALRRKVFEDKLALPRNDKRVDGKTIMKKLITNVDDGLTLQTLELGKTSLPSEPSMKISVGGDSSLDRALQQESFADGVSVEDLKKAEFMFVGGKRIGIYTFGDDWERLCINTSTKHITTELESAFLQQVAERLDGIDIKKTRLILDDLTAAKIVTKLLRDRKISTNPPIPELAEKILVELTKKRILSKAKLNTQRRCFNCWTKSWDQWLCPGCDRGQREMRIVGEQMNIELVEQSLLTQLNKSHKFKEGFKTKLTKRQRNSQSKPVIIAHNELKNLTTYVVLVQSKKDITYVKNLTTETLGIVAIVDPKVERRIDEIENYGASVVMATDVIVSILEDEPLEAINDMVESQEQQILERIFDNARSSLTRLKNKPEPYTERDFEVDIKNIFQMLSPEVVWLGAKYSGKSVPDGYLAYSTRPKRLLGWDAKYSETGKYRLSAADARKQKGYIDWLQDVDTEPSKLAGLGCYAIIANFDNPKRMVKTINTVADYDKIPAKARVAIIEDQLIVKVGEWLITNWQQVIKNNSIVADTVFKWFTRKQSAIYTLTNDRSWKHLEKRLNKAIDGSD